MLWSNLDITLFSSPLFSATTRIQLTLMGEADIRNHCVLRFSDFYSPFTDIQPPDHTYASQFREISRYYAYRPDIRLAGMKWRCNSTLTVQALDDSRWNRSEKSSVKRKIFNFLHSLSVNDWYHIKVSMKSALFIYINFLVAVCTYNDLEARSGWPTNNYVPLSAIS